MRFHEWQRLRQFNHLPHLGLVELICNLNTQKAEEKNHEFEDNLDHTMRPWLKIKPQPKNQITHHSFVLNNFPPAESPFRTRVITSDQLL